APRHSAPRHGVQLVGIGRAVVLAAVDQSGFAEPLVAPQRAADRRVAAAQLAGDPLAAVTLSPTATRSANGCGCRRHGSAARRVRASRACAGAVRSVVLSLSGIPSGLVGARPSCEVDASFI